MKIILIALALFSFSAVAQITPDKLAGEWATNCIKSQMLETQGYVIELYTFQKPNEFQFRQTWYKDANCKKNVFKNIVQKGTFTLGKENTNNGFNPAGTLEVEFVNKDVTDKGLVWMDKENNQLRISRGMG
ncbi:MAG: hypothetical protein H0V66_14705, partial [Bdellovibrionales bacterium]|nr:hypothetical protein [Bdellovibrionales bacterium]